MKASNGFRRLLRLAIITALPVAAQNGPYIGDWAPPASESPVAPKLRCSSLRALTGYEFSIVTAVDQPAEGEWPAYCRVIGQALPEIQFEVNLPAAWNSRLYMYGNGGYAGEPLDIARRGTRRDQALKMGFTVTSTDTGHQASGEPLGAFGANSQKLIDYAFRSLHVTAVTAKKIAEAYYGIPPRKSYYNGCSTGGRQGLILAQRFPQDFDGIVAGMPVLDFTGTMVRFAVTQKALAKAPIPLAKVKLLAARIYQHCDAKDGLRDGLISDPRQCGFEPARHLPICRNADGDDCFTQPQIAALEAIYGDVHAGGNRIHPGWPVGPEIAAANGQSGWRNWFIREDGPTTSRQFAEAFFRYFAFPTKDPKFTVEQFDPDKDVPRLDWIRSVLDATDPDLTDFQARGGRLLMYFGWADQALNPRMGVEYYEAAKQRMGPGLERFFKLYMMPGVFHCGGGVGPGSFDPLKPLIQWVEESREPGSLKASQVEGGRVIRTRPLCPYPQVARYKGSGDIAQAENFVCAAP